jgi:hypothetical protein
MVSKKILKMCSNLEYTYFPNVLWDSSFQIAHEAHLLKFKYAQS